MINKISNDLYNIYNNIENNVDVLQNILSLSKVIKDIEEVSQDIDTLYKEKKITKFIRDELLYLKKIEKFINGHDNKNEILSKAIKKMYYVSILFGVLKSTQSNDFSVILFYKLDNIDNPEKFTEDNRLFCLKYNLLGRILVAKEGANITLSGFKDDIAKYKDWFNKKYGDTWFKEHECTKHLFPRLSAKVSSEIVVLGKNIGFRDGGEYITPKKLNELIENEEIIIFDTRNEIESRVGKFRGAICPKINSFRDLPKEMEKYKHLKDKKIVTYCTGGIRCEKFTVEMKKQGFTNVMQLEGGIYNYCNQYPQGYFEGNCFVFDDRMVIGFSGKDKLLNEEDKDKRAISFCEFCQKKTSRVIDDERFNKRQLRVCCKECDSKFNISKKHSS